MADESQTTSSTTTLRAINWREVFPFVHLFRAFRVAVHPSKLVLALVALLCIYSAGRLMDGVWPERYKPEVAVRQEVRTIDDLLNNTPPVVVRQGVFDRFFLREIDHAESALEDFRTLRFEYGFSEIWAFVGVEPAWLWGEHWVFALIFTTVYLLVWSLFGGAISRIAAVHVARDEKISVRQALRFSSNKLLSFLFAPLIPLLIVFGIGIVLSACSWALFHIPVIGPIVAGLLYIFALLGGLVMTLVLLGTLGGFNLMYPTIGVEGSDSFDAISRSFSYVFARPWRMLFYTLVTLIYGAICYLFVKFFIFLILALTRFFMGWWLTSKNVEPYWPRMFPPVDFHSLVYHIDWRLKLSEKVTAGELSFWNYLVISLLGAFAISFYFSANTIIYYLMRREVDATELEDVYREEADDELSDTAPITAAPVAATNTTTTTAPIVTPSTGATDAPGGGVTDTAGSSPPGGEGTVNPEPPTA